MSRYIALAIAAILGTTLAIAQTAVTGVTAKGKGDIMVDGSGYLTLDGNGTVHIQGLTKVQFDKIFTHQGFVVKEINGDAIELTGHGVIVPKAILNLKSKIKVKPVHGAYSAVDAITRNPGGPVGPPVYTGPSFTVKAYGSFDKIDAVGKFALTLTGEGSYQTFTGLNGKLTAANPWSANGTDLKIDPKP
jgi:hypothetical protein